MKSDDARPDVIGAAKGGAWVPLFHYGHGVYDIVAKLSRLLTNTNMNFILFVLDASY